MNQPADDRSRGLLALRAAGVGLGVLGATVGSVAGWFTLEPAYASTSAVATVAGTSLDRVDSSRADVSQGLWVDGLGRGPAHTRTGGR